MSKITAFALLALYAAACIPLAAQTPPAASSSNASVDTTAPPRDYVIGPDDQLSVVFWREKDMSADVVVRPDGKISLPLLNDVQAAGLTPPALRDQLIEAAKEYIEDPNVTIVVRQINSRRVFVTGEVAKPGPYPLTGQTTVLQILATAGGLREYADDKHIVVLRIEDGHHLTFKFNYRDVAKQRNLAQNVELKPGDTIIVP
jgi:polysaccharide export outer membrane protein